MNMRENLTAARRGLSLRKGPPKCQMTGRRGARWLVSVAGVAVLASTTLGGSLASAATSYATGQAVGPNVVPNNAIVGAGLLDCAAMTGIVGYTVPSIAGGTAAETISIWFEATKCTPAPGSNAVPVPKEVTGSMSFPAVNANGCPQLGNLGQGTLNLAYNYPPVGATVIDPSVAMPVNITQAGPLWNLTAGGALIGSYPSGGFSGTLKPVTIGGQNCGGGITSEYITRGTLTNV
jgi:hypothetical protein